jgi:hypothetical protein
MKAEVQVGDVVRVSYEGVVESTSGAGGSSMLVNGTWHYTNRSVVTSVEIIRPALRVGWHRVTTADGLRGITARHWDGNRWGQSELGVHGASDITWTSIGFLGGGDDE